MNPDRTRRLALRREPLADLSPADLGLVRAGTYDVTPQCPTNGPMACLTADLPICAWTWR